MNTLDDSWSSDTHDRPKLIVFQVFQPRVVELPQISENFVRMVATRAYPDARRVTTLVYPQLYIYYAKQKTLPCRQTNATRYCNQVR